MNIDKKIKEIEEFLEEQEKKILEEKKKQPKTVSYEEKMLALLNEIAKNQEMNRRVMQLQTSISSQQIAFLDKIAKKISETQNQNKSQIVRFPDEVLNTLKKIAPQDLFFYLFPYFQGEFGQIRYSATLSAGEKRRIPLLVPGGRWWLIFKYRFGDITADVINFRFDSIRNYFEQNILITSELLNWVVEPRPYILVSGNNGAIVVENTSAVERDFSIILDFVVLENEIAEQIRELILEEREKFRGKIVQKQYKTQEKPEYI